MAGRNFLFHRSSRAAVIKPLSAAAYNFRHPIKRYSKRSSDEDGEDFLDLAEKKVGMEERAPSLAKEFKRVSEEKSMAEEHQKEAEQGVASQTMEKVYDGAEEATIGDGKVDSAKNRYKKHEGGADYHRKPPSDGGVNAFGNAA